MKTELDSYKLKAIAASAMLLDHIAFMFLTDTSPAGLIIHFIGRLAAPIFCFLTAEGYEHTRDLRKYLLRMAAAAAVSIPCFNYFYYGSVFVFHLNFIRNPVKDNRATWIRICICSYIIIF